MTWYRTAHTLDDLLADQPPVAQYESTRNPWDC